VLKPQRGGVSDGWVAVVAADGKSLDFLTYFGTNDEPSTGGGETLRSLGTDSSGNIWIGGETLGTDLTPTADAFQAMRSRTGSARAPSFMERMLARFSKTGEPGRHAYVAKLSPDGRRLVYLSWLGGDGYDDMENEGISDAQGNFYVAGSTASADFPTTPGVFQSALSGAYPGNTQSRDAYLAKINDDGSLGFVTLFGGSAKADEVFFGPAIIHAGNICATGFMRSSDMPVTAHALQPHKAGAPDSKDAVLACFSPDGTALRYASYFGGSENEGGRHIAAGPDGRSLVIVGETRSHDLLLKNPASAEYAAAWVAKFTISD
ncbi:MAG: hypothetical protein KJO66_07665, partial [Gammaproteobacteria bacterium]|nr:hypothetical protein [Gammaproteobacteria bacterium]